jgi:hypothetical protein
MNTVVDLVSLRKLVADKECRSPNYDGASGKPLGDVRWRNRAQAESSFSDNRKALTQELPEKSRKFLENFLADRGSLL